VERAAELQLQLTQMTDFIAPTPQPDFDQNGIARLTGWKPRQRASQKPIAYETVTRDGKQVWHAQVSEAPLAVSLRHRLSLPAGRYRLAGQITMADGAGPAHSVSMSISRNSPTRFGVERQGLNPGDINFNFEVSAERAPEEIELICDVRSASAEAWVDAGSLLLMRGEP
jgi:hypothetical protein